MLVLGIDPGTAVCGFGVIRKDGSRIASVAFGAFGTPSSHGAERRLKRIYDTIAELIAAHEPDAVALEESFVGIDARTALSIGQARGAVLLACANRDVPCAEYPPATVKQTVCGYGRADKAQVQRMVKAILRLESDPCPHHAADALAVALCHALASPLLAIAGLRR